MTSPEWARPAGPWSVGPHPAAAAGSAWTVHAGSWTVGNSAWTVGNSAWSVGEPAWSVGAAAWSVGSSAWTVSGSEWSVGESAWTVTAGSWSVGRGMATDHAGLGEPAAADRRPVERELVAIWRKLLDVDRISIHDNFFELGGSTPCC